MNLDRFSQRSQAEYDSDRKYREEREYNPEDYQDELDRKRDADKEDAMMEQVNKWWYEPKKP